ncbi:MAG: lysophospholipid acyltransferase family protein [Gallionellaceae bacterium]
MSSQYLAEATLLTHLIAIIRSLRFVAHLCKGLAIALIYPYLQLSARRKILQKWSRKLLSIFNITINFQDSCSADNCYQGLIITNHISWLDVFVLNAIVPMRFVAKSEVRRWPVIGWLCERVQTFFIERGSARSAARINVQLVELLKRGESLAVFPEGTTTEGTSVAHFHSSLIQPAIDAGAKVFPMAIRYHDRQGMHSKVPAYIDEVSFGASLWTILTTRELHVQLVSTPVLEASGAERRQLTLQAQQNISAMLDSLHAVVKKREQPFQEKVLEPTQDELQAEMHFQSLYGVLLNPPMSSENMRREVK